MNEPTIKRYITRLLNLKKDGEGINEIWNELESAGWSNIINIAQEQQVITFLFHKLKQLGQEAKLSQKTLRIFSFKYQEGVARNGITRHVLKDIIRSFNQYGIKAIILKGAINFCENIYENWNLRSMEDLDILIKEEDFPAARQCMNTAGIRYIEGKIPNDLSEDFESRDIAVDMHYLPVPKKHINLFDMDSFWSNTMCVEIDGIKAHIPSPTDQIYHKFIHDVIRHQELVNFRIQGMCDFIMTSQYYSERIDWEEILRRVRRNDIESLFNFYCRKIKKNLKTELPQPINHLSDNRIESYERRYDQLSECPEWLDSASERLMAILIKGGNISTHLRNSFNILVKESVLKESKEFLLSLYCIKKGKFLLPLIRTIHLCRVLFLHIMIIAYLAKQRLSTHR